MNLEQRPHLEPIQEESEQEGEGTSTGDWEDEEDFPIEADEETKEETEQDESEEDEDVPLKVLRPMRLSRSFLQEQSTNNRPEGTGNVSDVSDLSALDEERRDEASFLERNDRRSSSSRTRLKASIFSHSLFK